MELPLGVEEIGGSRAKSPVPKLADTASASLMQPDSIVYDLQPLNEWRVKSRVCTIPRDAPGAACEHMCSS